MKYLFEKLEVGGDTEDLISNNIYYKIINAYKFDHMGELEEYIKTCEPRLKECEIFIKEDQLIIEGEYETRIFEL